MMRIPTPSAGQSFDKSASTAAASWMPWKMGLSLRAARSGRGAAGRVEGGRGAEMTARGAARELAR